MGGKFHLHFSDRTLCDHNHQQQIERRLRFLLGTVRVYSVEVPDESVSHELENLYFKEIGKGA